MHHSIIDSKYENKGPQSIDVVTIKKNETIIETCFTPEKEFSIILFCRCNMRFTHANRHCPDHPLATLRRSDDFVLRPVASNPEQSSDVLRWLERY